MISDVDQRLIDVLFDDLAISVSAPIRLPMPHLPELRSLAEKWLNQIGEMAGLDNIVALSSMSRRTLTRTFKKETGMSVGKWRQLARLMTGIEMLSEGKSVTETAMFLGYDSISSFVTLCKRLTDMSPKAMAESTLLQK
ncbi:helix-turn-helix transcriptional regulator [Pseudomonas fluorescens]|uniref:helix-turn-helix transcriptional regulator n=1 Tax=Pseudomonas fluorescens TaxID=294 RepID=UPI001116F16D|nr:helix-turn-helix transcriptional regulator [Pseudomonas fluorescens]